MAFTNNNTLGGFGLLSTDLINNGVLDVSNGTREIGGALTSTAISGGTIDIESSGTLLLDQIAANNTLTFEASIGTLDIAQIGGVASSFNIAHIQAGDVILLPNAPSGYTVNYNTATGTLAINNGTSLLGNLVFTPSASLTTAFFQNVFAPVFNGVTLTSGGTVTNPAGTTINGKTTGVVITGGAGTVTNGGAISGSAGDAISLAAGFANRVVVNGGAAFNGVVDGGNPAGSGPVSILELSGSGGQLNGLGSEFVNFGQIQLDSGASWILTGANSIASGVTLADQGQLQLSGPASTAAGGTLGVAVANGISASASVSAGSWTGMGPLLLGGAGNGSFVVNNAGTAGVASVDVAAGTGATGTLTVTGAKSLFSSAGTVTIGDQGLGVLSVQAGGTVTDLGGLTIANAASTSSGSSASVVGGGSAANITSALVVAASGSGGLSISAGGSVTAGSLDTGASATGIGQISVTGTGSALTLTGNATIADSGTGALSVLGGAVVTAANISIGNVKGSSGAVLVSGAGSSLLAAGVLNIGSPLGAAGGVGDLTVAQGAFVSAPVVNYYGNVVVENGTIDPILQIISSTGGGSESGLTSADVIINEGTLAAAASGTLVVQGTVVGGGGWTENGVPQTTAKPAKKNVGVLEIGSGATMELTGPVLNTATFTTTDNLTPTNTYAVSNSVIDVTFDDSTGVLKLDNIGGFAGTITGIQQGDAFVVSGGTVSNIGLSGNNTITFTNTVNNVGTVESILFASTITPNPAGFSIVNGNTIIACFAAGTKMATLSGAQPVEALAVGDMLVTQLGGSGRIVWTGSREVNCAAHPHPETVWPVRIAKGAIEENVPARDLYVSPDHALYIDNVLVPAKHLINGTTIRQIKRRTVTYHHIELEQHDVVVAEGMPAESYLDTGDKAAFAGGKVVALYPDFAARTWEMLGCAPLVTSGPRLDDARRAIDARAARGRQIQKAS